MTGKFQLFCLTATLCTGAASAQVAYVYVLRLACGFAQN